jgi:hypothetical protein
MVDMATPQRAALLKVLANVVKADTPQTRATTLLFLASLDRIHLLTALPELHAELGTVSPGLVQLRALVDAAEEASSPSAPVVRKQHFISQTLLARWTTKVSPKAGAGKQLIRYTLATGAAEPKTTGQVGYKVNFVKIDSAVTERLWKATEDNLPVAIAAAEDGSMFAKPELQVILRDAVALHFARNPLTKELHESTWSRVSEEQLEGIAQTDLAKEAFRKTTGIHAAGEEAERLGARAALQNAFDLEQSGGMFRFMVEQRYERVRALIAQTAIEVVVPADPRDEFLIGDRPAMTYDSTTGAAGLEEGVGLAMTEMLVLPLGPRLMVALGHSGSRQASSEWVEKINQAQVRTAKENVFYQPGSKVGQQVAKWRPAKP